MQTQLYHSTKLREQNASHQQKTVFPLLNTFFLALICLFMTSVVSAQTWTQLGTDLDGVSGEGLGVSVSLSADGNTMAIGSNDDDVTANNPRSSVKVKTWNGTAWVQKGSTLYGEQDGNNFGFSVSLSADGETLAVGAHTHSDIALYGAFSNSGRAYVYDWSGTDWVLRGDVLIANAAQENFGNSVSLSADGIVLGVGAPGANAGGTLRGLVRVYKWTGSAWQKIGNDILGGTNFENLGTSVSLRVTAMDSVLAVGGPSFTPSPGNDYVGHVKIFRHSKGSWRGFWSSPEVLTGDNTGDYFGYSVSLSNDGNRLAIGAPTDGLFSAQLIGYARIFDYAAGSFTQVGTDIISNIEYDNYGDKLALSGNGQFVIIGARGGVGNENGRAEIYTYNAANWQQVDSDIIGEGQDDLFGQAVAINETGTVIAIGGSANDGGGADAGNVRTFTQACSPPAAPTGTVSQAFCSGATLAQVVASGTEVKWYNATVGGTLLPNNTILTNGTVYYASQTISDCESTDRLAVTVTLNTIAAPTGSTSQEFCNGATIANLVVTGTDIIWYDAATGGTALNSTDNLTNGTLYYASQTVGGCESTSLAVTATVSTTPSPTATGQVFCNQATVANLVATGTNIKWYTAATGGIPLSESVELATNVALTFYASQTLNGCESTERTAVFAGVYLITAPAAEATQVLCSNSTIADLTATLMEGAEIFWYANATGGTALESTTPLVDGTTYYAEQLFSAFCPSTNRTAVSVELLPVPSAPVSDVTQPTCVLATGSISITTQQGGEEYSFNNGEAYQNGNSISGLTAGEYQVVIRSSDGCVSSATAVTINAQPFTPTTPVVTITQPTCTSNTGTVTVTVQNAGDTYSFDNGANYQSSNAKSGLATGDYNVIIKSTEGCTSAATLATVDAAPSIPNAPTGNTEQAFCSAATVAQLTATGTAIKWYATETGGTPLATTTALTNNTTYYASQTVGCESTSRLAVAVTVNTPTVPTGEATQTFCTSEATVAELTATASETISWYTTPTGGTPLAASQVLTKGTYYAGYSKNGCESARLAVAVDYAFFWNTISAGSYHTLGIKQEGTLWAWGWNDYGQLGDGSFAKRNTPVQISTGKWIRVTAGYDCTLGIKQDGTLWAWGHNSFGQLGDGTNTIRNTPVQIGNDKWSSIEGSEHTLGIKQDGTLWAWGRNDDGQLGDGTNTNRNTPVQLGSDKWTSITSGAGYTLGIKQDGTLWAWGRNDFGQLGDGSYANRNTPVQIGSDKWTSITAGVGHTLGIKQEGTLWAWGRNDFGLLGDGTNTIRNTPVQIGTGEWTSIKAGYGHTLGIKQEGTLWAWGINSDGQLGDGTTSNQTSPTRLGAAPPVLAKPALTVDFTNDSQPLLTTAGGSEYVWYKNGDVIEGANEETYAVPSESGEGLYTVATIGERGCRSPLSNEIPIYITALDFEPEASIQLYPNPAQESLLVKVEAQVQLSVVSINGHVQNVSTEWLSNEQAHRVYIKDLISGMYILQIHQNGKRAQVKFIKQ